MPYWICQFLGLLQSCEDSLDYVAIIGALLGGFHRWVHP